MAAAAMRRDTQLWQRRQLFKEGVHSAHPALPRYLSLLHLREISRAIGQAFLRPEQVLELARRGEAAGCTERCHLGDKPELRYRTARQMLAELGHDTTISYPRRDVRTRLRETSLMPHVNAGVDVTAGDAGLRRCLGEPAASCWRARAPGCAKRAGVHHALARQTSRHPATKIFAWRGELSIPFTTGILIGIGETRAERLDSLVAIADLHGRYGHIQEVIVQNFRAKRERAGGEIRAVA